jgi:peptide/nickel transport system ATP-binding protein
VSGVVLTIIFATWLGWLNGSAASATEGRVTFYNFALPVATVALYGMGYARSSPRSSRRGSCARQARPGAIDPHSGLPYLFGGDKLARDVFGRVIAGARIVLIIAPLATLLALSAGVMLGLPAGYSGGRVDAILSFLANLVLAFPIIVLFYLLVSPGILETPIPYVLAAVFFAFPVLLLSGLFISGYRARPGALALRLALTLLAGLWLFATFVFNADPLKLIQVSPSTLNIFVAVALASGPGIFRIVRSLTLDIKTREYVFAAQTRGESPGDPAQRARAADRRRLPAHRLHHHPARRARLFRLGDAARKPELGHDDQRIEPLHAHLRSPRPAASSGADVVRSGLESARGRDPRAIAARLTERGMAGPLIEIDRLGISFFTRSGEIPAVMDFSCRIMPGQAMGLVGESGCGKSTVALAILRDLPEVVANGAIRFEGRDMASLTDAELRAIRGSKIAIVYQEPMASLNPTMLVGRQLMEVPLLHDKVSRDKACRRAVDMVKAVRLPDPDRVMRAYPHQLSGGQQQRVVTAMALLSNPKLLILDEPTTALDVTVEAGIVALIKDLTARTGASSLFISHNLGLILETCDEVTVMYSGEAVETGAVRDVFGAVGHPYTQELFRSMPMPGTNKKDNPLVPIPRQLPLPHERPEGCNFGPRCEYFMEGLCDQADVAMREVAGAPGHLSRCLRVEAIDWAQPSRLATRVDPVSIGAPVLAVERLKKHYRVSASALFRSHEGRAVKAIEDVSFEAREAEVLAIVGESGCGKSTPAKVLLGLEMASDGLVVLDQEAIQNQPVESRAVKTIASIQMILQNPFDTLNPSYSVGSQILRTLERFRIGANIAERREMMLRLLDLVKLPRAFAQRSPRQLSGGQKQRIGVARAFTGRPRVIIADEPMSALDVSVQAAISELLMSLQRESKTTMVFISHDLSVVRYLADRVVVMYLGHILEMGSTEQIFTPPFHPYTEALLSAIPIADLSVKKRHVVLEGEIPSARSPPSGCPFQTRCGHKRDVAGDLCEREMPPTRTLADGHTIKCHLPSEALERMEPVFA